MSNIQQEEIPEVNLGLLRDQTEEEIKYLLKKARLEDKEIYIISKEFFKKLLDLDYESTYEELINELDKIYLDKELKKEIQAYIINIGQIEYSNKKFSQEELKVLLEELRIISKKLIHIHRDTSFINKLLIKLGAKKDSKSVTVGSLKEVVEKEQNKIEEQVKISKLRDALIESEKAMDQRHDEEAAKKEYQKAMKIYSELPKKQQDHIYPELVKTYNHLS